MTKLILRILAEVLLVAAIVAVIWAVWLPSLTVDEESDERRNNEWRSND